MKAITQYPHPVTDAMVNKFDGNQSKLASDAISLCEILERKLAACREALEHLYNNACAACEFDGKDYVIRATAKEWSDHVKATSKAKATLAATAP